MQRSIPFLWAVVVILVIFNLILLDTLNLARLTAVETMGQIEAMLDRLAHEVIVYEVRVNQAVPIKADVPINRTLEIPVKTTIPIDRTVTVPFQFGASQLELNVPLKADFPIDVTVPVNLNETIPVDTTVQLDTTLPIEIDLAQTPLADYLIQAKLDIARLRHWLSLEKNKEAAAVIPVVQAAPGPAPTARPTPQAGSDGPPAAAFAGNLASTPPLAEGQPLIAVNADSQADLVETCAHPYWPLQTGLIWKYNSRPGQDHQWRVQTAAATAVQLELESGNNIIRVDLGCSAQGLTGSPVGDLPKLAQLGELQFINSGGVFLPDPPVMETSGRSWTQTFSVSGVVTGYQEQVPVKGKISQGQAEAVYTATGFENLNTVLGEQPAVRIEQRLTLELLVEFNTAGGMIPVTETVQLTTVFWFAKNLGPLKMEWRGGSIEQTISADSNGSPKTVAIAPLPTEYVVEICGLVASSRRDCILLAQPGALLQPDWARFKIPAIVLPPNRAIAGKTTGSGSASAPEGPNGAGGQPDDSAADKQAAILAYAENVAQIGEKITAAGESFGAAAIAYRNHEITLDTFKQAFAEFKPVVTGLIRQIATLSPPSEANGVHQQLTAGLGACHEAVGLMDEWFDTQDSDLKAATALLVAGCLEQVEAAEKELAHLVNSGPPVQ
jgi:hypothetical protein